MPTAMLATWTKSSVRNTFTRCTPPIDLREHSALKRGGAAAMVTLTTGIEGGSLCEDSIGPLDESLKSLKESDARSRQVVEMRSFVGMSEEESVDLSAVSAPTVKRDGRKTRAFLFDTIGRSLH
ncbi:MAG: ECF-type sigma factor [Dokdonella sp.]